MSSQFAMPTIHSIITARLQNNSAFRYAKVIQCANAQLPFQMCEGKLTRASPRREPCELRQICWGHPLPANFFTKCITRKCLTLKMKVKVMEYTNRNSPFEGIYQLL